jgi:hypothetical protein
MSFTNVFGGSTIFPSDVSYLALALSADVNLSWPLETTSGVDIAARIIDVTPTASGWSVYLPDATKTGAGQTILFNNVSASYTVYVKDYAGNTLATLGASSQWQFYLSGVSTAAGTWRVFQYGAAGSGAVQPSVYAGYGLTVTGSSLSTASPVTTFTTTGTTLTAANRAGVFSNRLSVACWVCGSWCYFGCTRRIFVEYAAYFLGEVNLVNFFFNNVFELVIYFVHIFVWI